MLPKPISVKALPNYEIWIKFSDGVKGKVNLSHLMGKGVFKIWRDEKVFKRVYLDTETEAIAWNSSVELCPDSLYLKIIGKTFHQWHEQNIEYASSK